MPKNPEIKKVLLIGSGPIIIGQAAEFDYAGTQACRVMKEEGIETVLINSNPATIMTDKAMADHIYIEPLTLDTVKKVIEIEKPDSVLSTLGGQTGLTLSMQLAKEGFLAKHNVKLLGANPETIDKAEDRQMFKDTMESINQPCIASKVVTTVEDAVAFAKELGNGEVCSVVIRPAFTMGGTGGGIAHSEEELREICENGLRLSPITQVLIERCISGWKEIEFEVIRDSKGNVITVCSMENLDPVGVHTGDSIVIAPCVSLAAEEYNMLNSSALKIIEALGVQGGCNVQFALHPTSLEYAVIEVNPRVSRSSALASKATGYPIAKVASKIAIGYTLDEIVNQVTKTTFACNEPTIDYVVIKFPKFAFDKFVYAKRTLGTQMKATGEVMSIGTSFEAAFMKAVRGIELGFETPRSKKFAKESDMKIHALLENADDLRPFAVYEALYRGFDIDEIYNITKIDKWFLYKTQNIANIEKELEKGNLTEELYTKAKTMFFLDRTIERLTNAPIPEEWKRPAVYKMVDTCAAEFEAQTPYFYSTYDIENEAAEFIEKKNGSDKENKTIVVFGSGPIRIGQGIEFDYCSVHCAWTLRELGYQAVICNNNPETVSTDFDTADRLYFDPVDPEDVASIMATEKPLGAIVQFGGQTAIKLASSLEKMGVPIIGTSLDSIDAAEDREKFDELLEKCGIPRPEGHTVFHEKEAIEAANKLGYPVLMRPSYVLGGQNMIIAHSDADIEEYMAIITAGGELENPVLIDKYMMGIELEVDAISDGEDFLIPGIMEHIERAGVHSGDSISLYPSFNLSKKLKETIIQYSGALAKELKVKGLINIQYIVYKGNVYVIEVNPRSSRTVPYISKVTGVPMVELATRISLGEKLKDLGYGTGLYPNGQTVAVKVPVFSFEKLHGVDTHLGPEMKSTGEVLGIASSFREALLKGLVAAGYRLAKKGNVLFTVRDSDKPETVFLATKFQKLGFKIYATGGTAKYFEENGISAIPVEKIHHGVDDILSLIESGKLDYIVSTSAKGRLPERDSVQIRRKAVERSTACLTSLDTANALADCLAMEKGIDDISLVDITKI